MAEKKNVRIRLFKDNSRYKGDLFVSVNGVNYKIRRGVEVEVCLLYTSPSPRD